MKKKILTKKLIIATIAWLLILSAGAAAYLWFDNEITFFDSETVKNTAAYNEKLVEQEAIAKNISESVKAEKEYIKYSQSANNDKNKYRKNALISTLSDISKELKTVNLSVIMKPFEAYPPIPSSDGVEVAHSKVEMKFSALSDVATFQLLESIQEKLEGKVYIKSFDIEKIKDIDSNVLLDISNGGSPNLVTGSVNFDWIRIEVEPSEEDSNSDESVTETNESAPTQEAPLVAPVVGTGGQDV